MPKTHREAFQSLPHQLTFHTLLLRLNPSPVPLPHLVAGIVSQTLPLADFYLNKDCKDGRSKTCKVRMAGLK